MKRTNEDFFSPPTKKQKLDPTLQLANVNSNTNTASNTGNNNTNTTTNITNNTNTYNSTSKKNKKNNKTFLEINDILILIKLFYYFQKNNIRNQTLDRLIYESYCHLAFRLTNEPNAFPLQKNMQRTLINIIYPTQTLTSNSYWCQLRQLKAQLLAYRYLSRDIDLSPRLVQLVHGIDNPFSFQRPFIDPFKTTNPSIQYINNYDLNSSNNNELIIDNSPKTIEQLCYQNEYNAIHKLNNRRQILKNYISNCNMNNNNNNNNNIDEENAAIELQKLELIELQKKTTS